MVKTCKATLTYKHTRSSMILSKCPVLRGWNVPGQLCLLWGETQSHMCTQRKVGLMVVSGLCPHPQPGQRDVAAGPPAMMLRVFKLAPETK